jgi:hypothetical protein
MLRPQGKVEIFGDFREGVQTLERDTITCGHCNHIVMVKPGTGSTVYYIPQLAGPPREEPGAFCRVCMHAICLRCCDLGICTPLERHLEELEARGRAQRSLGG